MFRVGQWEAAGRHKLMISMLRSSGGEAYMEALGDLHIIFDLQHPEDRDISSNVFSAPIGPTDPHDLFAVDFAVDAPSRTSDGARRSRTGKSMMVLQKCSRR